MIFYVRRLFLCSKHNIEFEYIEKEFEDRADARIWIRRNQLDRRNLSDFAKSELALKHKDIIVTQAEERMLIGKALDPTDDSSVGWYAER